LLGFNIQPEFIKRISVFPAQLGAAVENLPASASLIYSAAPAIRRFLAGIDFSEPIDARGVGAKNDAYVIMETVAERRTFAVAADFDYFLELGHWDAVYGVGRALKEQLRREMRAILARDFRR
jgi:hypothetical protein